MAVQVSRRQTAWAPTRYGGASPYRDRAQFARYSQAQTRQLERVLARERNTLMLNTARDLAELQFAAQTGVSWAIQDMVASAVVESAGMVQDVLAGFAMSVAENFGGPQVQEELNAVWSQVASKARAAVVDTYLTSRKSQVSYRWQDTGKNKRYSNKVMLAALKGDGLLRVGPDGIEYMIRPVLDRHARQWYRLNFGAKPAGKWSKGHATMTFFGKDMGKGPNLGDFGPSKPFRLPPGIWTNAAAASTKALSPANTLRGRNAVRYSKTGDSRGGRNFYPLSGMKPENRPRWDENIVRMTKGIAGAGFLDAGVVSINRNLPPAIEGVVEKYLTDAIRGTGPLVGTLGVSPRYERTKAREALNRLRTQIQANEKSMTGTREKAKLRAQRAIHNTRVGGGRAGGSFRSSVLR